MSLDTDLLTYDYSDSLGNIRAKTLGTRNISLAYDEAKNRVTTSVDTGGDASTWTGGSTGTRNIAYDSRGNIKSIGGVQLNYDASDRPTGLSGDTSGAYRSYNCPFNE